MDTEPERLLATYTVLESENPDNLHAYIASMEGRVDRQVLSAGPTRIVLRHASLVRVEVGVSYVGATMVVQAAREPSADYLVQFPLEGSFDLILDGREISVTPGAGAVISPGQSVQRTARPGWTLLFSLPRDLVRSRLEVRLGRSLSGPLMFQPLISAGASEMLSYGLLIVDAIDRGVAIRGQKVAEVLEDGLIRLLLDLQPHAQEAQVVQSEAELRAARLRLVTEHIAQHMRQSLTVEQLAEVAGCGVRALQATFKELCGMSPLEYVRRHRLSHARRLLEAAASEASVASIAQQAGFTHVARFARSYKARYGELPSETLRRSR